MVQSLWEIYQKVPEMEISFEQFRKVGVERVKLLRKVENWVETMYKTEAESRESLQKTLDNHIQKELLQEGSILGLNPLEYFFQEHLDNHNIGHYLVKLAFSATDEHRQWLLK